ncbi:MAG TPA: hypothetical protein VEX39_06635 [Thermoleophilaceae bacterium]|nr:hypothetical protein [Thermoleophilaceae bacterium]
MTIVLDPTPLVGQEGLLLDPEEEIDGRIELDLHSGPIQVGPAGPDFGDTAIEAYRAKVSRGELVVSYSMPNRVIRIPLVLFADGDTLSAVRAQLQAKVGRLMGEGGVLKRTMADGAVWYANIQEATLKFGASSAAARGEADVDAELTLSTLPDWYGAEIACDPITGTGTVTGLIEKEGEPVNTGELPGRCRFKIEEGGGVDQLGLLLALRCRYFSSDDTAALTYAAQSLDPLDAAANATVASRPAVRHENLATLWTPVLGTNLAAHGEFLTHRGSYRLWVAAHTTSATPPKLRTLYDVGDLAVPAETGVVAQIPGAGNWFLVDLGEVRLDAVPAGDHRWQGVIQAKGAAGGENVSIAELIFEPLDESACRGRAPAAAGVPLVGYAARDEFNQSAGALAGKAAPVGGNWTGGGDSDDFAVEATGHTAQRSAVSDVSAINQGRFAISGVAAFAAQAVQVDLKHTDLGTSWKQQFGFGVVARYTDANNFVHARLGGDSFGDGGFQVIEGGSGTFVPFHLPFQPAAGQWRTIRLSIDAAGTWFVWAWPTGSTPGDPVASGYDPRLATGGALATGKPGFIDWYSLAGAATRNYKNFASWVPTQDAVLFADREAELSTEAMLRQDASGEAYGPISIPTGDLLCVPPSGPEERPVEVLARVSRGDLGALPDAGLDPITITPYVRPSHLLVPGG